MDARLEWWRGGVAEFSGRDEFSIRLLLFGKCGSEGKCYRVDDPAVSAVFRSRRAGTPAQISPAPMTDPFGTIAPVATTALSPMDTPDKTTACAPTVTLFPIRIL